MGKNVLLIFPNKRVLYTMPDNVYEVIKGVYMQFNIDFGVRTDFEVIYNQLPNSLKAKVKRVEGKETDFKDREFEIREFLNDPLDGLN